MATSTQDIKANDSAGNNSSADNSSANSRNKAKPVKRSFFMRTCRGLLWAVLALILLVVIILAIVFWLAGTDSGFSRLTSMANERVPGLNIEGVEGSLSSGINASSLSFANDAIDLKATNLRSDWRLGCLLERRFCLDTLHIDELDVSTFASTEPEPEEPARTSAIELPTVNLPIDIDISDVTIGTVRFQPPEDGAVQIINDIHLSATTRAFDDNTTLATTTNTDGVQSDEGSVIDINDLSLTYEPYAVQAQGQIALQGQYPLDLDLNVTADDVLPDSAPEGTGLQPLSINARLSNSLAELDITTQTGGIAAALLVGRVQPLEIDLPLSITLSSESLGWPVTSKSQVLAVDTRIEASGSMDDYTFSVTTQVSGEQVPDTGININGIANTERVTVERISIDTLNGNASGSALVTLPAPMQWSTQWQLRDIDPSVQVPDLSGQLDADIVASGAVDEGRWSLVLEKANIDGTLRELPFTFDAKLQKTLSDEWTIESVNLANDLNQIQLAGVVNDQLDIDADIQLPQLQNFVPGLAGGYNSKIKIDGELQSPNIAIDANAAVIKFNDILVQALSIKGDISELFINDSQLDINIDSVQVGTNVISGTAVSVNGSRQNHRLTIAANGPEQTAIDLALSGALDDTFNWDGLLEKVQAIVPGHDINLADPTAINWGNEQAQLRVAPHCWNLTAQSDLCLNNELVSTGDGAANITLSDYSLQQINNFLPEGTALSGTLASDVALSWSEGGASNRRAVVKTSIDSLDVSTEDALGERVDFTYEQITLDANVTPTVAQAALKLDSSSLGTAEIDAQFDPSDAQSALNGNVSLEGLKIEIAKAFLPDFDVVDGTISANGRLQGTINDPQYNGNIVLDSPKLEAEILPLSLTGGVVTAQINGQRLDLNGQLLFDEGQIDITGRGSLDPKNWEAQVNLEGKNLNLQSDPLLESTVNHSIRISVDPERLAVSGNIDIPMAVIDVAELPEGGQTVSGDVIIIEDEEEELAAAAEAGVPLDAGESALAMKVELAISLGEDVTLAAYGLSTNLNGDFDVRVRDNNPPELRGEINVVGGVFKKYGQDLEASGQILFVGPVDNTRLAIDAVREITTEDRKAGLRISGTAKTPEITLFTDPDDKSQDAVLSYIILGRDINEASDQEADLLATAMLALAVKGGGLVGNNVAGALGIQEFGIETRGSGDDTELIVSGRVNDRLLLRYGRGAFDAESTLYLRYDLTRKLYLEAAQGAQQAVDLFYSFSF